MVYSLLLLTLLLSSSAITSSTTTTVPPQHQQNNDSPLVKQQQQQQQPQQSKCPNKNTHAEIRIRLIASPQSRNTFWALLRQSTQKEKIPFQGLENKYSYNALTEPKQFEYTACMPRHECDGRDPTQELALRIEGGDDGDEGGKFDVFQISVDDVVQNTLRPANAGSVLIVRCKAVTNNSEQQQMIREGVMSRSSESPLLNINDAGVTTTAAAATAAAHSTPASGWELAIMRNDYHSQGGIGSVGGGSLLLKVEQSDMIISRSSFWHEACMVDTLDCYFFFLHR